MALEGRTFVRDHAGDLATRGYITHFSAVTPTPDGGLVAAANNDLYDAFIHRSTDGRAWEQLSERADIHDD